MLKGLICLEPKINELKSIHPDLNTYVSTVVDLAIDHYYNHIINEDGKQ
jgi:hypothetical protein